MTSWAFPPPAITATSSDILLVAARRGLPSRALLRRGRRLVGGWRASGEVVDGAVVVVSCGSLVPRPPRGCAVLAIMTRVGAPDVLSGGVGDLTSLSESETSRRLRTVVGPSKARGPVTTQPTNQTIANRTLTQLTGWVIFFLLSTPPPRTERLPISSMLLLSARPSASSCRPGPASTTSCCGSSTPVLPRLPVRACLFRAAFEPFHNTCTMLAVAAPAVVPSVD
jgi:hypothetical protein